jgi:DNA-binding beta-propeller fold protein YncE
LAFVTESLSNEEFACVSVWRIEDGSLVRRFGSWGSGAGELDYPRGIAVSCGGADRWVYVADSVNNRIQVFGIDGRFVRSIGLEAGFEFNRPTGICLDGSGLLYVTDNSNHRISVLNAADGSLVRHIGLGSSGSIGIAVGGRWMAVGQWGYHRVSVFDSANGSFLHRWGSKGSTDRQLRFPYLMCWSESHGVLVVPDSGNHRVLVYQ